MDIFNHGVQGFLLGYVPTRSITLGVICGVSALIPDLTILKSDNGRLYDKIHYEWHWLAFIPPITLHVLLDRLGHGEGKRWWVWKERLWLELLTWVINLYTIIIILKLTV